MSVGSGLVVGRNGGWSDAIFGFLYRIKFMATQDVTELNLYSTNLKDWSLHGPTGALIEEGDSFSWERIHEAADRVGAPVVKMSLGTTGGAHAIPEGGFEQRFRFAFSQLRYLAIWGVADTFELTKLPTRLRALDIRDCPKLQSVAAPGVELETFVVDNCPACETLGVSGGGQSLERLEDLSLKNARGLKELEIQTLLSRSPNLVFLNLSGLWNLHTLGAGFSWPKHLEAVALNDCPNLKYLPERWGNGALRRVELRNAKLHAIPDSWGNIDYVDLSGCEALREIPSALQRFPRTLFLYGSGVLRPPAAQHGLSRGDNVAANTRGYFEDIGDFGSAPVRRCKLLLLGNGAAGKTTLARRLNGEHVSNENPASSTHGVQFFELGAHGSVSGRGARITTHVWDFGGQALYHNTHRRFMESGAVYLILWNPAQDGAPPQESLDGSLPDRWHGLRYWLDLVRLSCPINPKIAVVCTHRQNWVSADQKRKIEETYDRQRAGVPGVAKLFFIDTLEVSDALKFRDNPDPETDEALSPNAAEMLSTWDALWDWIGTNVSKTVEEQGSEVPVHWDIAVEGLAQELRTRVDGREAPDTVPDHDGSVLSLEAFQRQFEQWIQEAVTKDDGSADLTRLARFIEASNEGLFEGDGERNRLRRALGYLTNIGMALWDPRFLKDYVIVDQEWAMVGVYRALERRGAEALCRFLKRNAGRFTERDLVDHGWREEGGSEYTPEERQVLLGFMEKVQACFKLGKKFDLDWNEDVYVSFAHLPTQNQLNFWRRFHEAYPSCRDQVGQIESDSFHEADAQKIIAALAEKFGHDGEYARDGFYLAKNNEGQTIWIEFDINKSGIGGKVLIHVGGDDADARAQALKEELQGYLPEALPESHDREGRAEIHEGGDKLKKTTVFISYAWSPKGSDAQAGVCYEEPANQIAKALEARLGMDVDVWLDRPSMDDGDSIVEYMDSIAKADRVIIVTSDRYYQSWCCMYEYCKFQGSLRKGGKSVENTFFVVRHHDSRLDESTVSRYQEFWSLKDGDDAPNCLLKRNSKQVRRDILAVFMKGGEELVSDRLNRDIPWRGNGSNDDLFQKLVEFVRA